MTTFINRVQPKYVSIVYGKKIDTPKRSAIILAGDLGMFKTMFHSSQLWICQPYCDNFASPNSHSIGETRYQWFKRPTAKNPLLNPPWWVRSRRRARWRRCRGWFRWRRARRRSRRQRRPSWRPLLLQWTDRRGGSEDGSRMIRDPVILSKS